MALNSLTDPVSELYGADLAHIHHAAFGAFSAGAAPGLLALFCQAGIHDGLVVDLGCGSGIWAGALTDAGYGVLGVDISPAMLRIARHTAPRAILVHASLFEVEIPRCAAVTAIGEAMSYDDGRHPGLEPLFSRLADSLDRGGLLVFDLVLRSAHRGMNYRRRTRGDDWTVEVEVIEVPEASTLTRTIEVIRRVGEEDRVSREVHRVRTFSRKEVESSLRDCGFSVRVSRGYGDYRLGPQRLAFRARKP
jgi:SAM-dependent methyltransferase